MKRTVQVAVIAVAALSALSERGLGVFLAPVTLPALWFVARSIGGAWRIVPGLVAGALVAEVAIVAFSVATGPLTDDHDSAWQTLWPVPIVLGLACAGGYLVASARRPAADRDEVHISG